MFKKYSSIENSYQQKFILKALDQDPSIKDMKFSIREKIDGANIQLYFDGKNLKVGKRSSFLSDDDNFFDIWNVLKKYEREINIIQNEVSMTGLPVRLFGEIYGKGIQKRVNYGEDKYLVFFDVEVNGEMWSQREFEQLMSELGITNLPPLLGYANNLSEALNWKEDFDSKVLGIENNTAEGIVIKPYDKDITLFNDKRFILKKKSESFAEKMKTKLKKEKSDLSAKVIDASSEFQSYLNDNRLKSIFSQHGEIEKMEDFGKYIKLMLDDAKTDFLKDYNIEELSEKELTSVFKAGGKTVAQLLKVYV